MNEHFNCVFSPAKLRRAGRLCVKQNARKGAKARFVVIYTEATCLLVLL